MAVLRVDSFNHYGPTLTGIVSYANKWDFRFTSQIINNSAIARTGTRCLQIINGSSGPAWNLGPQQIGTNYDHLIQGIALNFDGLSANSDVMYFTWIAPAVVGVNIGVVVNTDGSISVFRGAGDTGKVTLGTSAAGLFTFTSGGSNVWNYLQVKWLGDATNGSVVVKMGTEVNGVGTVPMATILTITGVKTVAFSSAPLCNQVQLLAAAGLAHNCYLADYYLTDWSDGSDFLGGVKIYASLPFANGSPVQFTSSSGDPNWENADAVPPDAVAWNSGTVGLIDQYSHNATGVPGNASILSVQHVMDLLTDTGARSVTSRVNGAAHANSVWVTNNFGMYTWVYDTDPATGLSWSGASFPASFGPEVTG